MGMNVSVCPAVSLFTFYTREKPRRSSWGRRDIQMNVGNIMWVEDWAPAAACRESQPDALFVRGAEQNKAKLVCKGCPVRTECLAEALDNQIEWGVWGGMTERERRALLRRRPTASWRTVLEAAKAEHAKLPIGV